MACLIAAVQTGMIGSSLNKIALRHGDIHDPAEPLLLSIFGAALPSLTHLTLDSMKLSADDIEVFAMGLQAGNFPALRSLSLRSSYHLGSSGLRALMDASNEGALENLEALDLGWTRVGRGMEWLAKSLRAGRLSKLKELVLDQCEMSDKSMKWLGWCLHHVSLPNLERLNLKNSVGKHYGSVGARAFCESLRHDSLPALSSIVVDTPIAPFIRQAIRAGVLPPVHIGNFDFE
mmetsp:Transcript_44278/g.87389  ORF Transcript_44278/g.87389 Transcript_44278/m.87389 type:complete len:233 (+) Transcript_44278:140-838(+)